jgi:hypothetical protein
LFHAKSLSPITSYVLFFLLGLISGTSHITLSLSVIVFGALWLVGSQALSVTYSKQRRLELLCFLIAVFIAMLLCHYVSPGAQLRKGLLGTPFVFNVFNVVNLFYFTVSFSFKLWVLSFFNVGALLVILISGSFFFIRANLIKKEQALGALKLAIGLSLFALLQILISRFAEAFTYVAYWHYVNPLVCIFLAIFFFGIAIAYGLSKLSLNPVYLLIAGATLAGSLVVGLSTNIFMVEAIYLRETSWALGAAPTEGVTDIEDAKGWQIDCWSKLNALRPQVIERQAR